MAAKSKRERAVRREEKAEGNRVRRNAERTGKQRGGITAPKPANGTQANVIPR